MRVGRGMIDFKPPPLFAKAVDGNADRWQHATWRPPSIVYRDIGCARTGTGAPEGNRSQGLSIWSTHLVTPETETSCHYHFGFARNFKLGDAGMSKLLYEGSYNTVLEDKVMLEWRRSRSTSRAAPSTASFTSRPMRRRCRRAACSTSWCGRKPGSCIAYTVHRSRSTIDRPMIQSLSSSDRNASSSVKCVTRCR